MTIRTDRYEEIRKALSRNPTPGPWEIREGRTDTVENAQGYPVCTVHYHPYERYGHGTRAAYIAACDPDTIRALLAERDALVEALAAQQPAAVDEAIYKARFERAPCYLCGYNGPGYYRPDTHPCAAKYHAAHSKQGDEQ